MLSPSSRRPQAKGIIPPPGLIKPGATGGFAGFPPNLTPRDLVEIDRIICEQELSEFVKAAWKWVDGAHYYHNWHIDAICEALEAVARGEIKRLLINMPPRHMKSSIVSIMFPAWVWAQHARFTNDGIRLPTCGPHTQFFYLSYDQELSTDHNVKTRDLIDSPWYRERWGDRFSFKGDENRKTKFENDHQGKRQASSVGGRAAGFGGDIIVVDDPHNTKQAESDKDRESTVRWFFEVLQSRLNNSRLGAFIVVMQRLHERDVSAEILEREWADHHICLPARYESDHPNVYAKDRRSRDGEPLWPARYDIPELDKLESDLGSYGAAGQLQQRPAPRSGGMFSKSWFPIVEDKDFPRDVNGNKIKILRKVRYWDVAASEDIGKLDPSWTVGVLMFKLENGQFWIEHVERFRENPMATEMGIKRTAVADGREVEVWLPQDPGAAGKSWCEYMIRSLAGFIARAEPVTGDKVKRAEPYSAQAEARNVLLKQGAWNHNFLDEHASFPMGRHKDQVDAAASAFNKLAGPGRVAFAIGGGRK
jgi:predicted phage terminase large subunit-like protein